MPGLKREHLDDVPSRAQSKRPKPSGQGNVRPAGTSHSQTISTADYTRVQRLILGVDFGTSHSGVSFCFPGYGNGSGGLENGTPTIECILNWPNAPGQNAAKTPTLINYGVDGIQWGYPCKNIAGSIAGMKLLLDPDQPRPDYWPVQDSSLLLDVDDLPKAPEDIVADYLTELRAFAFKEIEAKAPRSWVQQAHVSYILSFPATWSDRSLNLTMLAARRAGMEDITSIKEPEAAALWSLSSLQASLSSGQTLIVVDAGGGTVDLISYRIKNASPLSLDEIVPSKCCLAGSTGLNARFFNHICELIGQEKWDEIKHTRAVTLADRTFDMEKRSFAGGADEDIYVNFPGAKLPEIQDVIESSTVIVDPSMMKDIYEPLVKDIISVIDEQLTEILRRSRRPPSMVLLVGGMGSSNYLRVRVVEHLKTKFPSSTPQVIQPHDGWAAISKGAVLSMLPSAPEVQTRKCTRHYGIQVAKDPPRLLNSRTRSFSTLAGAKKIAGMYWFLYRDTDLSETTITEFSVSRDLAPEKVNGVAHFEEIVYQSESECAPETKDRTVLIGFRLKVTVEEQDMQTIVNSKDVLTCYRAQFKFVMTVKDGILHFAAKTHEGKDLGHVERRYE